MAKDVLNIVDENGKIIGLDTRENIHKKGLLHREVNVWFYTPDKEIIFQKRGKDKDTFPELLDATAGGHVEIGMNFVQAAVAEVQEETGLDIEATNLTLIATVRNNHLDLTTGNTNNSIKALFLFKFAGDIKQLKIEEGKADGFEAWTTDKLVKLSIEEKNNFIPSITEELLKNVIPQLDD